MYTRYCFSRSNFLIELVAGLGGALLCGVPGVIVGSFYGSVYPEISWGGLQGEPAAGMFGLLLASTVGGWLMVYVTGQLIHHHRSGFISFCGALFGLMSAIFLFDYSVEPWLSVCVLLLPVVTAVFGYNLPMPYRQVTQVFPPAKPRVFMAHEHDSLPPLRKGGAISTSKRKNSKKI